MGIHKRSTTRGSWSSSIGFILASAGAAVGLGNIQRFPYMVVQNGGAAFVLLYLFCVVILALPLMLVEFSVGRHTQKNPYSAIQAIKPKSPWKWVGALGILTAFCILSYYSVIGGWTFGYIVGMVTNNPPTLAEFSANPVQVFGYMILFLCIVAGVVSQGVKKGIEKCSKVFMPLLLLILLILMIRSVTLEGGEKGLEYYLNPDFSKITAKSFIFALSQAFFSLCIGEAVLVTYGSYASKKENLFSSAGYIAFFDTLVALVSGLIIFPALFAFGETSEGGIGLTFTVLPSVFSMMPLGNLFGAAFFFLLSFAAITTGIALLEIPVVYFIDAWRWKRGKSVVFVTVAAFILGIPSALSCGINEYFSSISIPSLHLRGVYEIMDFLWGGLAMVLGGGLLAVFVGWAWGIQHAVDELRLGCGQFFWYERFWKFNVRFIAPILILGILLSMFV